MVCLLVDCLGWLICWLVSWLLVQFNAIVYFRLRHSIYSAGCIKKRTVCILPINTKIQSRSCRPIWQMKVHI